MSRILAELIAAAAAAPSGDNTQPWRFVVAPAGDAIDLEIEPTRDPSPMNSGQRMARIAAGAALENLHRAAETRGRSIHEEAAEPPALVRLRLAGTGAPAGPHSPVITARVTNRRPYDGRPVPGEVLGRLGAATPELGGVTTHWITDRARLEALAPLIGAADALMFGEPTMRNAFLAKVRFDEPPGAAVAEGLSLGSLELTGSDRIALKVMRRAPDWTLKLGGAGRVFAAKATALVRGSSGLCVVAAPDRSATTDLLVGRAMQRAWLALTEAGLAAQPMMSPMVLANAIDNGTPALRAALGVGRVESLLREIDSQLAEVGGKRPAFLLRFGFAPSPSGRTGRLPVADIAPGLAAVRPDPEPERPSEAGTP